MSDVAQARPCGGLAVTLGAAGCVVGDATTGGIFHVGLTAWAREKVCVMLSLQPEKLNGSEDRFFAVFAAEHALVHDVPMERSRALNAARCACLAVVRSYCQFRDPKRNWCSVSHFSNNNQLRPVGNVDPDRSWFRVRTFGERFGR